MLKSTHRTHVWLVRHGQTQFNAQRRYQGCSDVPLTAHGEQQAQLLADCLRDVPFDAIIISPVERTRATVAPLRALTLSPPPLIEDANWHETNHGQWEGLTYNEVQARFADEATARFADGLNGRASGGERLSDVARRVERAWQALLHTHSGKRVLVVTSAGPIQLVLCHALGLSPTTYWQWHIDTGSITSLDVYDTATIIRTVNHVPRMAENNEEHKKHEEEQ